MTNTTLPITHNIWIISDTHFFHENIGRYCNRPENWQELIIKNWNDLISPDETVLHLGDFSFGKRSNFDLLIEQLHGKIILIRGNHDRLSKVRYDVRGVTIVSESIYVELDEKVKIIFSHWPVVPLDDGVINIHGHIHNSPPPPEGSVLGPNHINMSVEVRDYRPWRLKDILPKREGSPSSDCLHLFTSLP
ncbi:MAG: metallophosphoesterase [Anaerolineaceae bacterium]|jgi:calcineurin-like phosphoesterase family protein